MSRAFCKARCVIILAWLQLVSVGASYAEIDGIAVANICESAAHIASEESDVPLDVLRSISLTETGRSKHGTLRPWPWTVNMEGVGKWFDTFGAAQHYVERHHDRGARSFDVGCFQINYRWHGQHFESIEAMFDPITNARYAAQLLRDLYSEFGDWSLAAGAYHSRSPQYAKKYRARFDRIRANLTEAPVIALAPIPRESLEPQTRRTKRQNTFPLLQSSGRPASIASLVLFGDRTTRLIDLQGAGSLTGP